LASGRLGGSERGATGNTGSFPQRVRRSTMFARDSPQPFRESVRGTERRDGAVDHLPHVFAELHVFKILGDIVQSAEQAKGIAKC
jgi:hypothetical protein